MIDMFYCNYSNGDILIVHQDLPDVTTELYRSGLLIETDTIVLDDICLCRWYGDADPQ